MQSGERDRALPPGMVLGEEARAALNAGRPVVALESAVVTHGLPDPENLEAVRVMEGAVRREGAIPAVCLAHAGTLCVGADRSTIERVARDPVREKASVRDLGAVLSRGQSAGLTVSATIFAARAAGVEVFATGGIGGAHYPVESGDVSADLLQ